MATPSQGLLSSDNVADTHSQIVQKLIEDGLKPDSDDSEKLIFLWKQNTHLKGDLHKAKEDEQKLKQAQAGEMKEVESYVEHIRHLSDERETLIQELEIENEALKAQVLFLEQGNNDASRAEITEMLTQQGLADISNALQNEQIAYLLTERARLLDEVEERANTGHTNSGTPHPPETELKSIVEQEQTEFEEEMKQQRENAKMLNEQLKMEHEEEIEALMEENNKLEDDLQKAEMMVSQLKAELSRYTDAEDMSSKLNNSSKVGGEEDRRKLFEEHNELNKEREELENEMEEVEKDRADFQKEKKQFDQEKAAFERERSSLSREKIKLEQSKSEIEEQMQQLVQERAALKRESQAVAKKLQDSENKRSIMQEEAVKEKEVLEKDTGRGGQLSRSGSLSRSPSDLTVRKIIEEKTKVETEVVHLKAQLRALQKEKESHDDGLCKMKEDLEKSEIQQQQLLLKNRSLKAELEELETQLEETENRADSITKEKQNLSEKFDKLNSEVKTLRTDAMKSCTLQDIVDILNNDKKQLSQSLDSLKSKIEQAESEKTELANQNKFLSKGEQDLTNQLRACKQELKNVTDEKDRFEKDNQGLLSMIKRHEETERQSKADLEETSKMKEKFAHQVETLGKENKDLLNKQDRSREELGTVKQQLEELSKQELIIGHLKDQNQQLQNQVKMSQDELNKSRDRETMLISNQQALQKSHDGSEKRYICEIDDLKQKLELTLQELGKSKQAIEDLNKHKAGLGEELNKMKQLLKENEQFKNALEKEQHENSQMKVIINRLELQLNEKTILADRLVEDAKRKLELESQVESLRGIEENMKSVSLELEKEQKERKTLENQIKDLKKTISLQVSKGELISAQESADKERQLCSILELKVAELEQSVKDAQSSRDSANKQLENEKKLTSSMESNIKDLQIAIAKQVTTDEHAILKEELMKDKAALGDSKMAVQLLSKKFEEEKNLKIELVEMERAHGEGTTLTLEAALSELEQERRARADCDLRLQEIEQLLEDQKGDSENLNHSLSGKIMSLEKRAQALQDDLFNAQDELQAFQEKYDKAVKEVEMTRTEARSQQTQSSSTFAHVSGKHVPASSNQKGKDLEASLHSASHKLQETLNELNTVKSKLCQAQEELESSRADVSGHRNEMQLLRQSLHAATKQVELSDDNIMTLRHELVEAQGTLQLTQIQLREKQSQLDSIIKDKDAIQRDLDGAQEKLLQQISRRSNDPTFYGEKERQMHIDKSLMQERLSQQLDLDNREIARKLSDTLRKCEMLEEQLQKERQKNADKFQQRNKYASQQEKDINTANNHIRHIMEELQKHQAKTFRLETENLGLTAKYQSTISHLEQDIKEIKQRNAQEQSSLRERMASSSTESTDLREQKKQLEQELSQLKLEMSRQRSDNKKLEKLLRAESKQKMDLENKNSVVDGEISKMWSQVRSLMEKNTELESTNHSLEQDLNVAKSTIKQVEATLAQKEASTANIVARAETSERNARALQTQLEGVTDKMLNVERQLAQADLGNVHLQDTKDTLVAVRHQLEGEKLQRLILDHSVAELKHQVALLKQRESNVRTENKEFQHTILDLESHLSLLQKQSNVDLNMHQHISEVSKDSLVDQINRLQREVNELQHELYNMSERRDADMKRYEERKLRTKAKLMKARALYTAERSRYMDQMKNMDEDLRLTHATLAKEKEWGKKMDDSYKLLLSEKRELISHKAAHRTFFRLSEAEEGLRDSSRTLSMVQAKVTYLEEENHRLQNQLQVTTEQKHDLNKQLLKVYGNRETNFVTSSSDQRTISRRIGKNHEPDWDTKTLDELNHTWPAHIDPPASFRRSSLSGVDTHTDVAQDDSSVKPEDRIVHSIIDNTEKGRNYPMAGSVYSLNANIDDGDEFEA